MKMLLTIIALCVLYGCAGAPRLPQAEVSFAWLDDCWRTTDVLENDSSLEIYIETHGAKYRVDKRRRAAAALSK